jgi:TonB family protein
MFRLQKQGCNPMRVSILLLSVAGLLVAGSASAAHPADAESQRYAERANARAASLLQSAGVDAEAATVSVRAKVSADGNVTGVQVMRSSGSADTDRAVAGVLRKILVSDAPLGLMNGAVTLNVGHGAMLQATGH